MNAVHAPHVPHAPHVLRTPCAPRALRVLRRRFAARLPALTAPLAAAALLAAALAGCDDMSQQPKQTAYAPAVGPAAVPAGTVQYLEQPAAAPPLTLALLQRGQERYRIYCTPCHSELGDGRGMVVQRGFPPPPSFHIPRLQQAPAQYFYDVITRGHGAMYSFAARVAPPDRWAIAAYIRALQISQDTAAVAPAPARRGGAP